MSDSINFDKGREPQVRKAKVGDSEDSSTNETPEAVEFPQEIPEETLLSRKLRREKDEQVFNAQEPDLGDTQSHPTQPHPAQDNQGHYPPPGYYQPPQGHYPPPGYYPPQNGENQQGQYPQGHYPPPGYYPPHNGGNQQGQYPQGQHPQGYYPPPGYYPPNQGFNPNITIVNSQETMSQNAVSTVHVANQFEKPCGGHSLILHLLLGWIVWWIPSIYFAISPKHYFRL